MKAAHKPDSVNKPNHVFVIWFFEVSIKKRIICVNMIVRRCNKRAKG